MPSSWFRWVLKQLQCSYQRYDGKKAAEHKMGSVLHTMASMMRFGACQWAKLATGL